MNATRFTAFALVASAVLAGCASNVPLDNKAAPVESRATGSTGAATSSGNTSPTKVANVDLTKNAAATEVGRVVYFDYDSFVVKDEYRPLVEAHARYLQSHRNARMTVQGNTDERGSREYNIALGQKRADAVKRMMTLLGAQDSQIETTSFGEERPKNPGHDESAWAENRRDDIVYAGE